MKTLEGRHVRLLPMQPEHLTALNELVDPELWQWIAFPVTDRSLADWVRTALAWREAGTAQPFVIEHRESGKIVGSTRFANISRENRRLEIGWSWVGRPWQRSPVNTEAKYLMLKEAFEGQGMQRVELKTGTLNTRSRAAIRRIGAREEGILRRHMITATGQPRDTVYHAILESEWPAVKARLEARLRGEPVTPPASDIDGFCRAWLSAWTGNRPETLRAFYTDDAFYRDPARPAGLRGEELLPYFRKLLARNPDWKWEAVETIPTARGFILKWKATIPTAGGVVEETGLDIVETEGDRIARNEVYFNPAALSRG